MALRVECGNLTVKQAGAQKRKVAFEMGVRVFDGGDLYAETVAEYTCLDGPNAEAAAIDDLAGDAQAFLASCEAKRALEQKFAGVRGAVGAILNPEVE